MHSLVLLKPGLSFAKAESTNVSTYFLDPSILSITSSFALYRSVLKAIELLFKNISNQI